MQVAAPCFHLCGVAKPLNLSLVVHNIRANFIDNEYWIESIRLVLMLENNGSFSSKPYFPSTIPIMRIIISVFVDSPIHQLENLIPSLISKFDTLR